MTKELLQEQLEILDRTNMHKNAAKERIYSLLPDDQKPGGTESDDA